MVLVGQVVDTVLWISVLVLIARFIIEWVQVLARSWRPQGFVLVIAEAVYTVTDPPLQALRRVIKPVRLGSVALDLSPMVLLLALFILRRVNAAVFF
ncbi:MAG: YggT family protein [Nocardioidaceae bacterium]|jgi:YggT family protein|nr:YggT family protein [Nocardioidaceae bacterium]MDQ3324396.1 YggT family protein [Actinomycetota bacterium]